MKRRNNTEIIDLTKKLITFQTVTKNQREINKCLDFISEYLKEFPKKIYESNGFKSLVISNIDFNKNKKNFDLILHGHIDVVPPNQKNQFIPYEKDEKIYGRGALDMKGGVACIISLMKNLKEKKFYNKKILLLITSDEEIGGQNGTEFLLKRINFSGKFFITAEGEKDYFLKYQQKGVLMLKINAFGKGEHSAYTWVGKNAIEILIDGFNKIKKLFPKKKDKNHWYTTVNLGMISGGEAINSIPDYAEAKIDIRFCQPYLNAEQVLKKIRSIFNKKKEIFFEILYKTDMMFVDKKNKYLKLLNKIAKETLNLKKDLFFKNHGTNDARFASQVGIPSVGFGPVGNNYHAQQEFVYISSLFSYNNILEQFVKNI